MMGLCKHSVFGMTGAWPGKGGGNAVNQDEAALDHGKIEFRLSEAKSTSSFCVLVDESFICIVKSW